MAKRRLLTQRGFKLKISRLTSLLPIHSFVCSRRHDSVFKLLKFAWHLIINIHQNDASFTGLKYKPTPKLAKPALFHLLSGHQLACVRGAGCILQKRKAELRLETPTLLLALQGVQLRARMSRGNEKTSQLYVHLSSVSLTTFNLPSPCATPS